MLKIAILSLLIGAASPAFAASDGSVGAQILGRIAAGLRYPHRIGGSREVGTAVVAFTVDGAGRAGDIALVRSSGSAALDRAALRSVAVADSFACGAGRRVIAVIPLGEEPPRIAPRLREQLIRMAAQRQETNLAAR